MANRFCMEHAQLQENQPESVVVMTSKLVHSGSGP